MPRLLPITPRDSQAQREAVTIALLAFVGGVALERPYRVVAGGVQANATKFIDFRVEGVIGPAQPMVSAAEFVAGSFLAMT